MTSKIRTRKVKKLTLGSKSVRVGSSPTVMDDGSSGDSLPAPSPRRKINVSRSIRSAKEFITQSHDGRETSESEELASLNVAAMVSPGRRPRARSRPKPTKQPHIGTTALPYDTCMRLSKHLFDAMGIDQETQWTLQNTMKKSSGAKRLKKKPVCSDFMKASLEMMKVEVIKMYEDQERQKAATVIQSVFRSYRQQKKFKNLSTDFNSSKIDSFHHLCNKEKDFVMSLATLISQYIVPLRVSSDKHLKKINCDLSDLFSNIENILEVHQTILKTLYELPRDSWPSLNGLGNVFTYISPHWKIYGSYVHSFKYSLETIEDLTDNNEHFRDFLEKKSQGLSTDLTMLLSLPLNHISVYSTCLKQILEETPDDTPEHNSLLQAISITTETSNFIGNALAAAENIATIRKLRKGILPSPETEELFVELSGTNSKFVHKTTVEFVPNGSKKNYKGLLYIFDNICFVTATSSKGNSLKQEYRLKDTVCETQHFAPKSCTLYVVDEEQVSYGSVVESSKLTFTAATKEEMDFTVQTIQSLIAHNQRTRTFGVPLESLIERDKVDDCIPIIVRNLVTFIEEKGLDVVGIFRIPGTATAIKKAKIIFNQSNGNYPTLESLDFKPNDAAGLLKMFFHDLPEPLIPHELYTKFITIFPSENKNLFIVLEELKSVIDAIPDARKKVLEYMISFLVKVAAEEENKMGPSNLATCFGTNILRPKEQTIESTLSIPRSNSCVEYMIQYFDILFQQPVNK